MRSPGHPWAWGAGGCGQGWPRASAAVGGQRAGGPSLLQVPGVGQARGGETGLRPPCEVGTSTCLGLAPAGLACSRRPSEAGTFAGTWLCQEPNLCLPAAIPSLGLHTASPKPWRRGTVPARQSSPARVGETGWPGKLPLPWGLRPATHQARGCRQIGATSVSPDRPAPPHLCGTGAYGDKAQHRGLGTRSVGVAENSLGGETLHLTRGSTWGLLCLWVCLWGRGWGAWAALVAQWPSVCGDQSALCLAPGTQWALPLLPWPAPPTGGQMVPELSRPVGWGEMARQRASVGSDRKEATNLIFKTRSPPPSPV